jgi:hypothetical protein
MTSRFDIIDDKGDRLISGVSHGDACEHLRFWNSRGMVASMQPAEAGWNPEHDRRPWELSLAEITAECRRIQDTWKPAIWHGNRPDGARTN